MGWLNTKQNIHILTKPMSRCRPQIRKKKRLKRRRCTGCAGTYLTCVHVSCHRSFFHRLTITDGNGVACAAQRCPGSGTKRYGQIMARSCHASL